MSVLQFPAPRAAQADGYMTCDCGSAWFEIYSIDREGTKHPGAVSMDETGRITGYSGTPHCIDCGREKLP